MSIYRNQARNQEGRITRVEDEMRGLSEQYGKTSERPVYKGNSPVSVPYFDRELNKPIWWNGAKWVDADGSDV